MARSIKSQNLETRTARAKLEPRKKPYWQRINRNCQIGYYRGKKGGTWVARFHSGESRYLEKTIGFADDMLDATGIDILTFYQAQEKAREWFEAQERKLAGLTSAQPVTLKEVTKEYLEWFKANRKSYTLTKQSVELHILPALGDLELSKLTTRRLQQWLDEIATSAPRAKRSATQEENFRSVLSAPEQRKATANRQLNILKAILNYAFHNGYADNDQAWRRLKPYRGVDNAKIRFITEAECQRLINACDSDFQKLVQGALYTGCRYGELVALKVSDYNCDSKSIYIAVSKSGKARHIALSEEGNNFFKVAILGKQGSERVFTREDGGVWQKSHQARRMADASKHASISPQVSFHILRHTYASQLAMRGVPLQVIATQLGHADTRTCEKHYAHLCPSYVAETIRKHLPDLGFTEQKRVIPIR